MRQDIFSRANWSPYSDTERFRQEIGQLHIFGQHRYPPGHFHDDNESAEYQRFITSLNPRLDALIGAHLGSLGGSTHPYDSERSEDGLASEVLSVSSDLPESDGSVNGKDPASPDDDREVNFTDRGQDEELFGRSSTTIRD